MPQWYSSVDGECVIGLDAEWPVTYVAGSQSPVALVQVCVKQDVNMYKCYLFHLTAIGMFLCLLCISNLYSGSLPASFVEHVLNNKRLLKAGVNVLG
jgi:hypothetical protein